MFAGERLTALDAVDVTALSIGQVHAALRDIAVVRGTTDRIEAAVARRLVELNEQGDGPPAPDALTRNGRTSRKAAERVERRAATLGETPMLDRALGAGKIGSEHADALANAAGPLDGDHRASLLGRDEELTELAASLSPAAFRRKVAAIVDGITDDDGLDKAERQVAATTLTFGIHDDTGMYWFRGELAPEDGVRFTRAIDHEVKALANQAALSGKRSDHLAALALVDLITGARNTSSTARIDMIVTVPLARLDGTDPDAPGPEYSDGSPLPVATARRLACDANIIPVVLGGDAMPLDVGRARRLATPSQRAVLRSVYRTCAIGDCDTTFDRCHIHHLTEWEHLGSTDIDNLVPLCSFHHHRAHEGRWQLQLEPSTRQLTVHLPNGSLHSRSLPDLITERAA